MRIHHDFPYGSRRPKKMPTDLNGMTEVGFGLNCPFLHIWNKSPVRESNTKCASSYKIAPIDEPFAKRCYEKCSHDCSNPPSQTSRISFCHHSYPWAIHYEEQTQNSPIHCPHTPPDNALEGMQTFIHQLLAWDNMTCQRVLIPIPSSHSC